jgi:hypothetical protein
MRSTARSRASAVETEADRRKAVFAAGRAAALVAAALPGTHTWLCSRIPGSVPGRVIDLQGRQDLPGCGQILNRAC